MEERQLKIDRVVLSLTAIQMLQLVNKKCDALHQMYQGGAVHRGERYNMGKQFYYSVHGRFWWVLMFIFQM